MRYYDATQAPIQIRGLVDGYNRLPGGIIGRVNDGVTGLACNSAGGRVRFATDSSKIEIEVKLNGSGQMSHMTLLGKSGVDFYVDGVFAGSVMPPDADETDYSGTVTLKGSGKKQVEINLPLYNGVTDIVLGTDDGALLEAPRGYTHEEPIVFYGSSITQGGCASRPGNCYTSFVARRFDADHINLGFSGSARGETIMAEYIAGLKMSAFVLDYDHNAPSAEHLMDTHSAFFNIVRAAQPQLPIVIVTKPDFDSDVPANTRRRAIIMQTYLNALEAGDENVYFCDGKAMFSDTDRDACTVDGCHPNDIGFYRMADAVCRELVLR